MLTKNHCGRYISVGQTVIISAAFALTCCVFADFSVGCGEMLADVVISSIMTAVLSIPTAILHSRQSGSTLGVISRNNAAAGKAAAALCLVYFISAAADMLESYCGFVSERYFIEAPTYVPILLAGAVCIYISHTGPATVCRMSALMLALGLFAAAVFAVYAADDISCPKASPAEIRLSLKSFDGVFPYQAAAAACIIITGESIGRKTQAALYGSQAAFLGVFSAVSASVFAVLGDFTALSTAPVTDAVIFASRSASFKTDGLFFALFTITAVAAVSLLCACGGEAISVIFPKLKGSRVISAGAAVIFSAVCAFIGTKAARTVFAPPPVPLLILGVLPTAALIIGRKTGKESGR